MIEIRSFDYTPILGWSSSRYDKFRSCRRQYYYHYYGKHDREFSKSRIDRLKRLTSIPLEIGKVSHEVIAAILHRLLKSNIRIDRERFEEFVDRKVARACAEREFFEVYYAQMASVRPEDIAPAVHECMGNLLASDRFDWIRERALRQSDDWLIEPPGYGEARLGGLKIYSKVDFLFLVDGRAVILDWKTGRRDEEKHLNQLLGYSVWAMYHLGLEAEQIDPVVAYLRPEYDELRISPTSEDLARLEESIISQTEEMYSYCSNYPENIPRDKDSFPMTDSLGFCSYCSFKELCGRS